MNKDQIKALYFDLDHTLWDFEANSALAFQSLFEEYNIALDLHQFLAVYIPNNNLYWKRYREGEIDKETLRFERLKTVFDALNYPISNSLIDDLSDAYIQTLPEYNVLFEGAVEMLTALKSHYALHVITNGFQDVQYFKMRNSGLLSFFDTVTDSSSVGVKKPDPRIFEYALRVGQVAPNQAAMVGDNLEADIEGALAAGMHAIHFMPLEKKHPSHYKEIDTLQELKFLL